MQHYQAAIQARPVHTEAHGNLANLYADQGRLDEARNQLEEALRVIRRSRKHTPTWRECWRRSSSYQKRWNTRAGQWLSIVTMRRQRTISRDCSRDRRARCRHRRIPAHAPDQAGSGRSASQPGTSFRRCQPARRRYRRVSRSPATEAQPRRGSAESRYGPRDERTKQALRCSC